MCLLISIGYGYARLACFNVLGMHQNYYNFICLFAYGEYVLIIYFICLINRLLLDY